MLNREPVWGQAGKRMKIHLQEREGVGGLLAVGFYILQTWLCPHRHSYSAHFTSFITYAFFFL